ncbi:MAG: hypothetical protein J7M18_00780 [Candidatus Eremiobacteraeota bacterium]|nr:hypothetical protein [Candidatus Eremiobacteraeota bacterium]
MPEKQNKQAEPPVLLDKNDSATPCLPIVFEAKRDILHLVLYPPLSGQAISLSITSQENSLFKLFSTAYSQTGDQSPVRSR